MKKVYIFIILILLFSTYLFAQVPQLINFQGVARDTNENVLINQMISLRLCIVSDSISGNTVYSETHSKKTDNFGLFSLKIGQGDNVLGTFSSINWGNSLSFIKIEIDPDGGINYHLAGTSQLISVPYALHAANLPNGTNNGDIIYWLNNKWHILPAGTYGQILSICNGVPTWGGCLSKITTSTAGSITYTSASSGGNISNDGGTNITARGICYDTVSNPTISNNVILSGSGIGNFTSYLNGLTPGKTYYIKAFATNNAGTAYGNDSIFFTTKAMDVPVIITKSISNISNTSAFSGGNITDDGGSPILKQGICWSLNQNPTITDSSLNIVVASGNYTALITGLIPNTTYHTRAFATNTLGTAYGGDSIFTTIILPLANVTTSAINSILCNTAIGGGNVTNDNGSSVTSRGVCWSTSPLPTILNDKYTEQAGTGSFNGNISSLILDTTYYVRAFAINGGGTSYGDTVRFTTPTPSLPSISTLTITNISSNFANSGGVISSEGCSAIIEKGICWSLNPSPTIINSKSSDGVGTANFNSTITGLNPLTKYYVRAYAKNGLGTNYGNEDTLTTTNLITQGLSVPILGTINAVLTNNNTTALSGGYISNDGGSNIIARGVCWSKSSNPTILDSITSDGTGLGYYTSTINGLNGCSTVYHFRAYATNSIGTGYGNQNSVTISPVPAIITDSISNIGYYNATSGGSIANDGGCTIIQKGICWSYHSNPTISDYLSSFGTGTGSFVSNITGLYANRTYYVRAYSTNSLGTTTYGPQNVFITATPNTLYIGQIYAGGIIFYIDSTGQHGLVCDTVNLGNFQRGCYETNIQTSTDIGTGASNTAAIIANCNEIDIAARICDDLIFNGYSDWFLPSRDELSLMWANLKMQDLGNFTLNNYWSSSANWAQYWWYGMNPCYDHVSFCVRAVRSF